MDLLPKEIVEIDTVKMDENNIKFSYYVIADNFKNGYYILKTDYFPTYYGKYKNLRVKLLNPELKIEKVYIEIGGRIVETINYDFLNLHNYFANKKKKI